MSTPQEPVLTKEFARAIIEAEDHFYYEGIGCGDPVWQELVKICELMTGVKAESSR